MSDTENVIEGRQVPIPSDIKDIDYEALKDFAVDYGCPVKAGHTKAVILAMLRERGWTANFIVVQDAPAEDDDPIPPPPGVEPARVAAAPALHVVPKEAPEPLVELTINPQAGAGGKRPIFVAVNGRAMLIPRGKPVSVKLRWWEALRIAEQTTFETDEESGVQEEKTMPSYPFQVTKMPAAQEIAAWRAWEAHEEAGLNPPKVKVAA